MNEAAIHAARNNARFIRMEDIRKSFIKVGIGTEKKSRLVPELERKITAYHEAGHAILFHLLPDVGPVYTVSIIPTGMGAAGYTMPVPENDNVFETRGRMIQEIKVGMGGRDVYKRQLVYSMVYSDEGGMTGEKGGLLRRLFPVSYTHLGRRLISLFRQCI